VLTALSLTDSILSWRDGSAPQSVTLH
jgi:hypothetical protein